MAKEVCNSGFNTYKYQEVIDAGKNAAEIELEAPTKDTTYIFSYTSGTTGNPKAVQLTHKMNVAVATGVNKSGISITESDTHMSFLPYAHSMEQCLTANFIMNGSRIGFYSGNVLTLLEDM